MATQPTIRQPDYPVVLLAQKNGTRLEPRIPFGPYLIHSLVRRSNMSLLCHGTRAGSGEPVALKLCRPEADRARFQREIEHTQSIHIRGVIKIEARDVGVTKDGCPFYATCWIEGPNLGEFLRDRSMSLDAKLAAVEELCRIVGVLHEKGLSHRDLKPSNVMVENGREVWLLDLGQARGEEDRDLTLTGQHVGGTPGYYPPWSLDDPALVRNYGKQWDVCSLAVILVEALTGQRPESARDPRFTPEGIKALLKTHSPDDRRFDDLLVTCLASRPEQCLPHADELYNRLRECRGLPRRLPTKWRRAGWAAAALSAILLVAVAAPQWARSASDWASAQWERLAGSRQPRRTPAARDIIIPNPSWSNRVVMVTVSPEGATVRVVNHRANGVAVLPDQVVPASGEVKLELPDDPNADYGLIVTKAGYQPNSQRILPGVTHLSVHLERYRGEVEFKTTAGARLSLTHEGGETRTAGPAPGRGVMSVPSLDEGNWTYRIELADHEAASGRITGLVHGKKQTVDRPLKPLPGRLSVAGHHTLQIWEGNQRLGPANEWIPLAAGTHDLQLRRPGFRAQSLRVEIPPNRDISRVAPDFVPEAGTLRLSVELPAAAQDFFAQSGKKLLLDGAELAVTSFPHTEQDVGAGPHTLRLEVEGFEPTQRTGIQVNDGQTTEIQISPKPLPARLVVGTDPPEARVLLVGSATSVLAGQTIEVPLFTEFTLEITAPGYQTARLTFQPLQPGKEHTHQARLEREITPPPPRLPTDLVAVADARPAPLEGLYAGSREAQARQIAAAKAANLPLEFQTAKFTASFRFIPAGTFTRGSPASEAGRDDDESQHLVILSRALLVGKYPVTQRLWREVMGASPSHFRNAGDDAPVESVSWLDVQEFLNRFCDQLKVPRGTYRLLTEAEWEYACRAGTAGPTYGPLDQVAWYSGNSGNTTRPVGQKAPNAFGLHDMLGNVWEWCSDWYGPYPTSPVTDPVGPGSGAYRVSRGGSWVSSAARCRAAYRFWFDDPGFRNIGLGCRLARTAL
ncbi:MAG: SUMF1/EgtB/PvdO family nonheme iron enzyme [Verrucomicrobiales bacterium]|nr:SUMF1/EgtB/PvdO family nonheme iron enzyme [Verrucomicrobiales bacterium]